MKTLIQINTNVGWNATGRIAEEIGRYAIENGWQSYIAYGRDMDGSSMSASKLIKIGNRFDVYSHGLLTRTLDRHGLGSLKATKDLIRRIDSIDPDIIHLHNIHGYYLNYVELFSYLARTNKPVVWTLHDCWPFTGHCAYFSLGHCYRWKSGCHNCPLKKDYPASYFVDNSVMNYQLKKEAFGLLTNLHLVAVSNRLAEVLRDSFLSKYPIYTIHNSVNISRVNVPKSDPPVVLAVASNWELRKGLSHIIKLRNILPRHIGIRIIGLTRKQIASLPDGCVGVPRINERDELLKEFARASVFINPSIADNLPMVNLEALASGTPLVAFASGGMRETVNSRTGIIVRTGDVTAMAQGIERILSQPGKYTSEACHELVAERFSHEHSLGSYLALYESLRPEVSTSVSFDTVATH